MTINDDIFIHDAEIIAAAVTRRGQLDAADGPGLSDETVDELVGAALELEDKILASPIISGRTARVIARIVADHLDDGGYLEEEWTSALRRVAEFYDVDRRVRDTDPSLWIKTSRS